MAACVLRGRIASNTALSSANQGEQTATYLGLFQAGTESCEAGAYLPTLATVGRVGSGKYCVLVQAGTITVFGAFRVSYAKQAM